MTTIKDIAQRLSISHSTVARALNDHPHISDDTKVRVRKVADELGYIGHAGARMMRGQRSSLIGFVLPKVDLFDMSAIARSVAALCNDAGYQLVLCVTDDDARREHAQVRALVEARAAGVIMMPTELPESDTLRLVSRMPSIFIIRQIPGTDQDVVAFDDGLAGYEAGRHLTSLGHKRIAYLGISEHLSTGANRFAGFRRALLEVGLEVDRSIVDMTHPREQRAKEAFGRIVERGGFTACVLANPWITIEALGVIARHGISTPSDLSVVGFGNEPWMEWWGGGGLTTIGLPTEEIAHAAATRLLGQLGLPQQASGQSNNLACRPFLLLRGSTAPVAEARRQGSII